MVPVFVIVMLVSAASAQAGLLPDRVEKAAEESVAANLYPTLIIGMVDGDKSEIVAFGKLPDGRLPNPISRGRCWNTDLRAVLAIEFGLASGQRIPGRTEVRRSFAANSGRKCSEA